MKTIYALLMAPLLTSGLFSCKKDKNSSGQSPCTATYTPYHTDTNPLDPLTLSFNAQRRLDQITVYEDRFDYRYEGNTVKLYENDELEATIHLKGGRAVTIERPEYNYMYKFKYNAEGYLSELAVYGNNNLYNTYLYTYENGNLKSRAQTAPGIENMKIVTTYTYTSDVADDQYLYAKMLDDDILGSTIPLQWLGKPSRNVLAGSSYAYDLDNNADRDESIFIYTKDASGKITAVKRKTTYRHYYQGNLSDSRVDSSDIRYTSTCN